MALRSTIWIVTSLALPALAWADEGAKDDFGTSQLDLQGRPTTTWVWVDPVKDLAADAVASEHISNILYVNRCQGGCTITPGQNDARTNTSSIAKETSTLAEFAYDDEVWNETIDCIKEVYSPYNVEVVTEDPGEDVFHHEAILAGSPDDLGLDSNIGGIAPSNCQPLNNVISFSFAQGPLGGDPLEMCWTVAQESAHSFGLPNHVFDCLDPMTYIPGCGKKYFRNTSFPCGETEVRPCNCSGTTQNSHMQLLAAFGPGTAPPAPEVEILFPPDGDPVEEQFTLFWDAQDPRLVHKTELWVNGTKYAEFEGHSYQSRFDNYEGRMPELPDGYLDIELRAYNDLHMNEGTATATYLKGEACDSAEACWEFQVCEEGRCKYPPAEAELGDTCNVDQECVEGGCAEVNGSKACSTSCNPTVTGACLEGFECRGDASGGNVCWPIEEEGGCCSVAGSRRDPLPFAAGVFFFALLLLVRRRRT